MVDFSPERTAARSEHDAWQRDNERGLMLAADGDWVEASEAFAAAADSLARVLPSELRSVHEPLALVLSNLAQAYFRAGRLDDAMQQAQRACALRVAIAGEDGMPVARARMDLAVMLASAGRLEEATVLIQRAVAGVEHRVGEEDARLAVVLENAARIALAAGHPANAEPLLLRLHALLDVHELSTASADALLTRVAEVRARQGAPAVAPEIAPAAVAAASASAAAAAAAAPATTPSTAPAAFEDDSVERVYAHASIAAEEEWEDQPLRDAVALTDVLLRTTPSGVPIIPAPTVVEPPSLDVSDDELEVADLMLDTMDLTDVLPAPSLREPTAETLLSLELAEDSPAIVPEPHVPPGSVDAAVPSADYTPTTDTDFDLDLAFEDFVSPVTADALEAVAADAPSSDDAVVPPGETPERAVGDSHAGPPRLLLDFTVEHGMVGHDEPLLQGPPVSTPIPDVLETATVESPVVAVVPTRSGRPSGGLAPHSDLVPTAPPSAVHAIDDIVPLRGEISTRPHRALHATDSVDRVVLPASTPTTGKGRLVAAIAAAVVVLGGAAALFLLR